MMNDEEAIGPRRFRLGTLTDEDFQLLCHLLVRLEFPDARMTDDPDSGTDTLLPVPDGGWSRGWQAKRYENNIYWSKCKDSLDRAVSTYGIKRMTFCFARNLTAKQHVAFQKHLVGRHPGVQVDFWNHAELVGRIIAS